MLAKSPKILRKRAFRVDYFPMVFRAIGKQEAEIIEKKFFHEKLKNIF